MKHKISTSWWPHQKRCINNLSTISRTTCSTGCLPFLIIVPETSRGVAPAALCPRRLLGLKLTSGLVTSLRLRRPQSSILPSILLGHVEHTSTGASQMQCWNSQTCDFILFFFSSSGCSLVFPLVTLRIWLRMDWQGNSCPGCVCVKTP